MNLDPSLIIEAARFMDVEGKWVTGITLSRSNLETLLAKLDTPGSAATILRQVADATNYARAEVIVIKAEEDAAHYNARTRQAEARGSRGAMLEDGATWPGQTINVPKETP